MLVLDVSEQGRSIQHEELRVTAPVRSRPQKWRGEPISLHLRDADLVDVLLALAKLSRTSIAIDPHVTGSVTIDLENVPSDQALDLILRQHGLAAQFSESVTTVKPR
jgi:type IV pilus assembly protein PilQ